jgi:hypothetical protein
MLIQKLMTYLRDAGQKDGTWRAHVTSGTAVLLMDGGLGSGTVWRKWRFEDRRW